MEKSAVCLRKNDFLPTKHIIISEPHNLSIHIFESQEIQQWTDFEVVESKNVRSGYSFLLFYSSFFIESTPFYSLLLF